MIGLSGSALQQTVDGFARALKVSAKLLELRPQRIGNPGHAAALSPAITLSVLAAFEGFAEDFTATALYLRGDGFGQIASKVGKWNNPTVRDFARRIELDFPSISHTIGPGYTTKIYKPPAVSATNGWWKEEQIGWDRALDDSDSWMQVRHCLTHGLATGWQSERWPGPLRGNVSASSVLRPLAAGKHSLVIHGALSCARIYVSGARHAADACAREFGQTLDWGNIPKFNDRRGRA